MLCSAGFSTETGLLSRGMATGRGGGFGAGFDVYFTGSRFLAGARDSQMPGWKSGKLQPGVPHLRGGFGATAALFGGIAIDDV